VNTISGQRQAVIIIFSIVVGLVLSLGSVHGTVQANALFRHSCQPDGSVAFFYYDQPWHTISTTGIQSPLTTAIITHQHQVIIMEDDVSLWALYHKELQIHRNDDPDGTKYIIPADSCGPLPQPPAVALQNSQALALAEAQAGGTAAAFANVSPDGSIFTFAYVEGPAQALAMAQTQTLTTPWQTASHPSGRRVHVVQPGEKLFRISLQYGIPLQRLAALNGITNIHLIHVGQVLYLE